MRSHRKLFYTQVLLPSVLIPLLVAVLVGLPERIPLGNWTRSLPLLNACINSATVLCLGAAWLAIRQGHVRRHRQWMLTCVALGACFFLFYILYHLSTPSVLYGDVNQDGILSRAELQQVGMWRRVYLILLFSHIFLAIFVVFFVLMALYYARISAFKKHKRLVRFAFPMWSYVSLSGSTCVCNDKIVLLRDAQKMDADFTIISLCWALALYCTMCHVSYTNRE